MTIMANSQCNTRFTTYRTRIASHQITFSFSQKIASKLKTPFRRRLCFNWSNRYWSFHIHPSKSNQHIIYMKAKRWRKRKRLRGSLILTIPVQHLHITNFFSHYLSIIVKSERVFFCRFRLVNFSVKEAIIVEKKKLLEFDGKKIVGKLIEYWFFKNCIIDCIRFVMLLVHTVGCFLKYFRQSIKKHVQLVGQLLHLFLCDTK